MKEMWLRGVLLACVFLLLVGGGAPLFAATYHVATSGSDTLGNGSKDHPWATISHALVSIPDGSVVEVHPGTYTGRVSLRGTFASGVTVRSQVPYQARLRNNDRVVTAYGDNDPVIGITLEGFDIAHTGSGSSPLVIHIDGGGDNMVRNISLVNNILHDSYNNDILKINNACTNIRVRGNIFYNQNGSDEHIDINSVRDVVVEDNIFFNDFEGSGRVNRNNTSSYIVIKDSNQDDDIFIGSRDITIRRNIFLHWQGSDGSNFVLIGEDGMNYYEGYDILVENNLMLGDSANRIRAAFGVKGGRDIFFRNNTVSGDLPALAYAMRLNTEGSNPPNKRVLFYNNIWVDQTGSMGAETLTGRDDFSDTPIGESFDSVLANNCYWNGNDAMPYDSAETLNYTDDPARLVIDPQLRAPAAIALPRWREGEARFADGSTTIRQAFERLVAIYAALPAASPVIDRADPAHAPADDILGKTRSGAPDIGAYERFSSGDGTEPEPPARRGIAPTYLLLL
jgi:hypothetical protein